MNIYYSYDPESGIEFHDTQEAAKIRAEKALDDAVFHAEDSDGSWHDNEHEISWGEVIQKVEIEDREPTPEEKADNPNWDFVRRIELEDVNPQPTSERPTEPGSYWFRWDEHNSWDYALVFGGLDDLHVARLGFQDVQLIALTGEWLRINPPAAPVSEAKSEEGLG